MPDSSRGPRAGADQGSINTALWRRGEQVALYANRELTPVEVVLLVRYREQLSRRVIELGCGAGRVLGYLALLAQEAHGVDISPAMVEYCRLRYPEAHVHVGDVARVSGLPSGPFDAVVAAANLLDVFDDGERRRVLGEIHDLFAPGGLLIFSSHNLAHADRTTARAPAGRRARHLAGNLLNRPPADAVRSLPRVPRRIINRRRLVRLERRGPDYAIVNDDALDYGLLHYYIGRDAQERQLSELGFELVECLDVDGRPVEEGAIGLGSSLHYVARAS